MSAHKAKPHLVWYGGIVRRIKASVYLHFVVLIGGGSPGFLGRACFAYIHQSIHAEIAVMQGSRTDNFIIRVLPRMKVGQSIEAFASFGVTPLARDRNSRQNARHEVQ